MSNREKTIVLLAVFAFVLSLTGIAQQKADEAVTCPVTGEVMKKSEAKISTEYKGKTYYFCCQGCKDKFLKDPEKYTQKQAEVTPEKAGIMPSAAHAGMWADRPMMMHGRMAHGRGMMMAGGMLLFSKDVEISIENTPDGAVIKLSSKNPDLVKVIQGHAAIIKLMREKGQACCQKAEVKKEEVRK